MEVRITMSYEPDWVVKAEGDAAPGEHAQKVYKAISDGEMIEAFPHAGGGTSAQSRHVVLNPAHVRSVHEVPSGALM
jgi:hypothetical protein